MVDEAYWINIGRMINSLKFTCYLSRSKNAKLGYRLLMGVANPEDDIQGRPLEKLLDKRRVFYTSVEDIKKVVLFLEKMKKVYDIEVLKKPTYDLMKYCLDNPPDYSNWESFILWAETTEKETNLSINTTHRDTDNIQTIIE